MLARATIGGVTSSSSQILSDVFRCARASVSDHMRVFENRGLNWKEETITDMLLAFCAPWVEFRTFTRGEEKENGADWLWWWVAENGEAFGMLVQAKRLKPDGLRIDFGYGKGTQRRRLLESAAFLGVPATYALYLGTSEFRAGRYCRLGLRHFEPCDYCDPSTVSLVPALLTQDDDPLDPRPQPKSAISASIPLEWLTDPARQSSVAWDPNWKVMSERLREFCSEQQAGARRVAQRVLQGLIERRASYLSHGAPSAVALRETDSGQVFPSLPADAGPFEEAYFGHVLRGLRERAPWYVEQILVGGDTQNDPPLDGLGGIVVVRC